MKIIRLILKFFSRSQSQYVSGPEWQARRSAFNWNCREKATRN
jgi:hypothetical protein